MNSLNEAISLMHRMGIISEDVERTDMMENYRISSVDGLLQLFSKYAPQGGWKMSIGYITSYDKIGSTPINSGRDNPFTDDEKSRLKSFNDSELSAYADNPVYSRKKYKNPYRPDSSTNILMKYTNFVAYWTKESGNNYSNDSQRQYKEAEELIKNNPNLVSDYIKRHPEFEKDYQDYISNPNVADATKEDYLLHILMHARGFNTKSNYEYVKGTPFKKNTANNQYMYSTYLKKDAVTYNKGKEAYFIVNPDTEEVRQIPNEQAEAVSSMFVSTAVKKDKIVLGQLEEMINKIKNKSDYRWTELNLNQIAQMKFSYKDDNGKVKNFIYNNKDVIVRIAKDAKTKEERYTLPGKFSKFDDIFN